MATALGDSNPYLRRPLYIYDLPPEVLETLAFRTTDNAVPHLKADEFRDPTSTTAAVSANQQSNIQNEDGLPKATTCALCQATFRDVDEQRQHVRSDFHRYNLKLSTKGLTPIDEQTFIKQIGDLDESISGSDSSESGSDEENGAGNNDSTLTALLKKQARLNTQSDEDEEFFKTKRKKGMGGAPLLWLSSPRIGNDTALGIYRAILSPAEQEAAPTQIIDILKAKQVKPVQPKRSTGNAQEQAQPNDPHFFLCMIGGGHFAAAVIGLRPEIRRGPGGVEERHAVVMAHKTFHRYTTRRKQGGSQSANDNAKGNAHSAGSSIRRYNEVALETDIRNVLAEWKGMIDTSELIFVRASGTTSRRTLFGPYDGQVLNKSDARLRGFPFSTRRATQNELLRAFQELTRVKVSTFTEIVRERPTVEGKPKPIKQKPVQSARSEEEEIAILHTSQLQSLIRRTKAPGTLLYLTNNKLIPDFEFFPPNEHHHAPRPLHLAASINSPALVTALLSKAKSNPTLTNVDGKTAYQVAGDGRTRDAFRVARHQLGEDMWDWTAAHVPSAISPGDAEAKQKREQDAADRVEAERRKADLENIRQQEEQRKVGQIERKAGGGKTLGAAIEKTAEEKREEEARGLTPEMKQRIERERRARAAEARMKALSGNK